MRMLKHIGFYTAVLIGVTAAFNACDKSTNMASSSPGGSAVSGSNGFVVKDATGITLGPLMSGRLPYPTTGDGLAAMTWNSSENVVVVYQVNSVGSPSPANLFMTVLTNIGFSGTNCTGDAFVSVNSGVHALNELFTLSPGQAPVYKTSGAASSALTFNSTMDSTGCANSVGAWSASIPVIVTTTSAPLSVTAPLQYVPN